jgi:hypothetical protein
MYSEFIKNDDLMNVYRFIKFNFIFSKLLILI